MRCYQKDGAFGNIPILLLKGINGRAIIKAVSEGIMNMDSFVPNNANQETRQALNNLAREKQKLKLLQDVMFDIQVCKLEGWNYTEYIDDLICLLQGLKEEK